LAAVSHGADAVPTSDALPEPEGLTPWHVGCLGGTGFAAIRTCRSGARAHLVREKIFDPNELGCAVSVTLIAAPGVCLARRRAAKGAMRGWR